MITLLFALGGGAALAVLKYFLGRGATADQQQVADLKTAMKEASGGQVIAENVHSLSDDELNQRLRNAGAGR